MQDPLVVTALSSDVAVCEIAAGMAYVAAEEYGLDPVATRESFTLISFALRRLLRSGLTATEAARIANTAALVASGAKYDEVQCPGGDTRAFFRDVRN